MRAKWLILLKVQLTGLLGINKAKHSDDARVKRRTAGGIAAVCIVGFVILFYAALIAVGFCLQGLGKNLPALSVALSSLIVFIFTLFQGRNLLFSAKDYDAVMSLPVSHGEIILSRLLCAYLSNLAFALAIALPVHVVYFVFEGFSPGVFGTALLASLLSPVLPLTLGAALSVLAAGLTARMKHRNLLQTLLAVAFFVAAMVASFSFSFSANAGENGPDLSAMFGVLVGKMYPPALLVDKTVSGDAVWGIFAFAGISLAAGALFVAIVSLFFAKINTALLSRASRAGYRTKDVRASSAFSALVRFTILYPPFFEHTLQNTSGGGNARRLFGRGSGHFSARRHDCRRFAPCDCGQIFFYYPPFDVLVGQYVIADEFFVRGILSRGPVRLARRPSERDDVQNVRHALFERGVDIAFVRRGEVAQVYRFGRGGIERRHEVLVHHLRHEGRVRRDDLRERDEHGVERGVRRRLVLRHLAPPVALAAAAHIPVGELVHEVLNGARAVRNVVFGEHRVHFFHDRIEF